MRIAVLLTCLALALSPILAQDIVIENDVLRLGLSADGKVTSLLDKGTKKEYAVAYPFATAMKEKQRTSARKLSMEGDTLKVAFGSFGIRAEISVEKQSRYIVFQLKKVEGDPEEITFFQLQTIAPEAASWGNILWFGDYCIGIVEGEPETRTRYGGGKNGRLYAMAYTDPGIKNNRVALYGCKKGDIRQVVGEIEKAFDIPMGVEVKFNEDNRRSYVMGRVGAADVDKLIDYARRGGFGSILMVINSWASYGNKYAVPERYWPGGLPQLKAAVDRIHAAGLKAGAHMFASKVPKYSDYTSPIPDKRIYKDCFAILAEDMDERTDRIVTKEPPTGWPRLPCTRDIHMDDELITYTELSLKPPYGFAGCKRGAYRTKPAAHKAGTKMGRPVTDESRHIFIIDQRTSLIDEVASNIARTYDGAGFDWMYFDGAEDVPPPRWYTTTMAQLKTIMRVKRRPVIVQNAASGPFCWHLVTRRGQRDYFWISMSSKDEVDDAIERVVPRVRRSLLAVEIGWFQWRIPTPQDFRTQIDEFEYLYTKALGADVAVSVQATADRIERHPQRDSILYIIGKLEELRIKDYFPERVKQEVLAPHKDFLLVQDEGKKYHLQPARELPFVAGTSREVRAMVARPINRVTTVSIWPTVRKVYLDVALLADKVEFTDYAGRPLKVDVLPGSIIRIPVMDRLYMKVKGMGMGTVRMAFRRAKVRPILPEMILIQAEEASRIEGRFTKGKEAGLGFQGASGDVIVPTGTFAMRKCEGKDYMEYTVDVPEAGTWKLWVHVRYAGANSNSFFLVAPAEGGTPTRFGNSANYGFWHWDGGAVLTLPKGPFTFRICPRETKAKLSPALDALLLVNDATYTPTSQDVKALLKKAK
ncbi:MAG: hypothetical protein GXP25_15170 [Planctomycetes bacterium]|nr:hypothetical protein [Planctomycetota bacterium]